MVRERPALEGEHLRHPGCNHRVHRVHVASPPQTWAVVGTGVYRVFVAEVASGAALAGGTWLMACSASAGIVSDGFTPGFAGTAPPSQTRRFSSPNTRLVRSTKPVERSRPITAPPNMCA